jgi:hypothetical protein
MCIGMITAVDARLPVGQHQDAAHVAALALRVFRTA